MGYLQPDKNAISLLYVEDEPVPRDLLKKSSHENFQALKFILQKTGKQG